MALLGTNEGLCHKVHYHGPIQIASMDLSKLVGAEFDFSSFGVDLRQQTSTRCPGPEKWFELKPGETKQYQTEMQVATADQLGFFRRYLKNGNLWLKENHSNAFLIETSGQFQIYALFERAPLSKEAIARLGFDNVWAGRAVSKPVTITIESVK